MSYGYNINFSLHKRISDRHEFLGANVDTSSFEESISSDFSLRLPDEESDWESESSWSNEETNLKINTNFLITKIPDNVEVHSTRLASTIFIHSEELFPDEQVDYFKADKKLDHNCNLTPLTAKYYNSPMLCETVYSQDNKSCSNLPNSCSFPKYLESEISYIELPQIHGCSINDLSCCKFKGVVRNILACVVTCYPIREIWCKSKKSWLSMAAILLGDYTNFFIKLMLWNKNCHYAISQSCGNLVFIERAEVVASRSENILTMKLKTNVVTLCPLSLLSHLNFENVLDIDENVYNLIKLNHKWYRTSNTYFTQNCIKNLSLPTNVEFYRLSELPYGQVVHIRVKIASIRLEIKNKNIPPLVCVYNEEIPEIYRNLYLNGSSRSWLDMFRKFRYHLWEIKNIACCLSVSTERVELHTTVFSTAECKEDETSRAILFQNESVSTILTYDMLLTKITKNICCHALLSFVKILSVKSNSFIVKDVINIKSSYKQLQSWLSSVTEILSISLTFTLKCKFIKSFRTFIVLCSISGLAEIIGVPNLKEIHIQTPEMINNLQDIFKSTFNLSIFISQTTDDKRDVTIRLKSVHKLT